MVHTKANQVSRLSAKPLHIRRLGSNLTWQNVLLYSRNFSAGAGEYDNFTTALLLHSAASYSCSFMARGFEVVMPPFPFQVRQ